jgi:hypothetical protein
MGNEFKISSLLFIVFLTFGSSLNADFLDNMVNKMTDKVTAKAEETIDKKSDAIVNSIAGENENIDDTKETLAASNNNVDKVSKLKELIQMKKEGYLTDKEFANEKAKLQM